MIKSECRLSLLIHIVNFEDLTSAVCKLVIRRNLNDHHVCEYLQSSTWNLQENELEN